MLHMSIDLARKLDKALSTGDSHTYVTLIDSWRWGLMHRELRPTPAIIIADKWNIPELQAWAYYVKVASLSPCPANTNGSPDALPRLAFDLALTTEQNQRLSVGYHSLVNLWPIFSSDPPEYEHGSLCTKETGRRDRCVGLWRKKWLEAATDEVTLSYGPTEVLDRLMYMERKLRTNYALSATYSMGLECRNAAVLAVQKRLAGVVGELRTHFFGYI